MIAPLPIPRHDYSGAPGDNSGEMVNACLTELDGRVTTVEEGAIVGPVGPAGPQGVQGPVGPPGTSEPPFHYIQSTDPGAVGADKRWLDMGNLLFKVRNSANTAWLIIGGSFIPPDVPGAGYGSNGYGGIAWDETAFGGTTITEDFNTANSDTLGGDLSWTELVGDIDIVSNKAQSVTVGTQVLARCDSDLDTDNHYVQAVVSVSDAVNVATPALIARKDSSTTATYYYAEAAFYNNTISLYSRVTGSWTLLATTLTTLVAGTPILLRLECFQNVIRVLVDGVQKISVSDNSIPTGVRTGIEGYKYVSGFITWENFEAGDLAFQPTPNAGFFLPTEGSTGWGVLENANWELLEAIAVRLVAKEGG